MELIVKLGGEFMRKIIHINDQWFYANDYKDEYLKMSLILVTLKG